MSIKGAVEMPSEKSSENNTEKRENLPIVMYDDVEFSADQADIDDLEALERAVAADNRQIMNQ
jgi:hypothetical protein